MIAAKTLANVAMTADTRASVKKMNHVTTAENFHVNVRRNPAINAENTLVIVRRNPAMTAGNFHANVNVPTAINY
jgi:hypothetical protein